MLLQDSFICCWLCATTTTSRCAPAANCCFKKARNAAVPPPPTPPPPASDAEGCSSPAAAPAARCVVAKLTGWGSLLSRFHLWLCEVVFGGKFEVTGLARSGRHHKHIPLASSSPPAQHHPGNQQPLRRCLPSNPPTLLTTNFINPSPAQHT